MHSAKLLVYFLIVSTITYGQDRVIQVFDMATGGIDSLQIPEFDSTVVRSTTRHSYGSFDDNVAELPQTWLLDSLTGDPYFRDARKASSKLDLSAYPLRTMVRSTYVEDGAVKNMCSGTLVSPRHVLTAAHCPLIWGRTDTVHKDILICPGFDDGLPNDNFDCSYVRKVFVINDYELYGGEDYAVYELEEPIGEVTGWVGVGFDESEAVFDTATFHKFSYPGIRVGQGDSSYYSTDTLYHGFGPAVVEDDIWVRIYSRCIPGASGSSIVQSVNNKTYTSYGVLSNATFSFASFTRLRPLEFAIIHSIIREELPTPTLAPTLRELPIVYPNPAFNAVTVNALRIDGPVQLDVFDAYGRSIVHYDVIYENQGIDLTSWAKGIYFFKFSAGGEAVTLRVVKSDE